MVFQLTHLRSLFGHSFSPVGGSTWGLGAVLTKVTCFGTVDFPSRPTNRRVQTLENEETKYR